MTSTLSNARNLRRNQTWAEKILWKKLRNRGLDGWKFRRQHPVDPYVIDFYCEELSLAIELDGGQHGMPENEAKDAIRSKYLHDQGIEVIRIWNSHLRENIDGVLFNIRAKISELSDGL